jgi:predicted MFS family arabinose efflux permease
MVVNLTCFLGLTPLYPQVARDLGLQADGLGVLIGVPVIVAGVLQLPTGVAVDALGSRIFMVCGLLLVSSSQVFRWMSVDPTYFAAGQVALGLSIPFFSSAAVTAVANAYVGAGRSEALGYVFSGANLGQISGFLLVGFLGQFIAWRSISLGLAVIPLMMLPLVFRMPEASRLQATASVGRRLLGAVVFLGRGRVAGLVAIQSLALGAGSAAAYLLPFALNSQAIGPGVIGLLLLPYLVGALLVAPAAGRIADRVGPGWPLLAGLLLGTAGAAMYAAIGTSYIGIAVCFLAIGAAIGVVMSLIPAEVVDLAERSGTTGPGAALGGLRLGYGIGPALAPPLVGAVFIRAGLYAAFVSVAVVFLAALLLCAFAVRRSRSDRPQPQSAERPVEADRLPRGAAPPVAAIDESSRQ